MLKIALTKRADGTWEPLHIITSNGGHAYLNIVMTSPRVVRLELEGPPDIVFVRESIFLKHQEDDHE